MYAPVLFAILLTVIDDVHGIPHTHEKKSPESRLAQHHLADSVTQLVHGERGLKRAQTATRVLFGEAAVEQLAPADLVDAFRHDPRLIGMEETEVQGMPVMEMLKRSGACASKSMCGECC